MKTFVQTMTLVTAVLSTACASTGAKDRTPSGQAVALEKKEIRLVQIVKLEGEQRALYMVEDAEQKKFSIAECLAPRVGSTEVLQTGATCTLISDQFVPDDSNLRASFDQAFTDAVREENKALFKKKKYKDSLANLSLAAFVGSGTFMVLDGLNTRTNGRLVHRTGAQIFMPRMPAEILPRVFLLGTAMTVGAFVVAALEYADARGREESTIESDLLKRAPNLAPAEAKQVALESYAAIRRCLIAAISFRQTI